jgi:hypothetical protein
MLAAGWDGPGSSRVNDYVINDAMMVLNNWPCAAIPEPTVIYNGTVFLETYLDDSTTGGVEFNGDNIILTILRNNKLIASKTGDVAEIIAMLKIYADLGY